MFKNASVRLTQAILILLYYIFCFMTSWLTFQLHNSPQKGLLNLKVQKPKLERMNLMCLFCIGQASQSVLDTLSQIKMAITFKNYAIISALQAALHQCNNLCRSRDHEQLDGFREEFASFAPGCLLLLKDLSGAYECCSYLQVC